ncbi:MAG TPA: flagellar hook-basal body complex protein FliE [Planctomycetes bacterium]|nr:flagellar hook-basal body complex protein FliE [Planctomycetota bacterium]
MSSLDVNAAAARIQAEFQKVGRTTPKNNGQGDASFGKILNEVLTDANAKQLEADQSVQSLLAGETQDVNQVMVAMAKADVSFRMMLEVRNKLIDAYQEVMRMQV